MKINSEIFIRAKYRFMLIASLLAAACLLTYYFRNILGMGTVFTHFFYIPIVLACVWWKRKGLIVTLILLGILIFSQYIFNHYTVTPEDYLRALMLLIISLITVALSERLALVKKELAASEKKYRTIFETTGTAMVIIEEDTTISLANKEFEKLSGFSKTLVENKKSWTEFVAQADLPELKGYHHKRRTGLNGAPGNYEFRFVNRQKEIRNIYITVDMIPDTQKSVASFADVTELKRILKEHKALQKRLSEALAKVLSGFIPICASCKKIRDENNNWVPIESYIRDRTKADFSHGMCQECAQKLYPEFINKHASMAPMSRA